MPAAEAGRDSWLRTLAGRIYYCMSTSQQHINHLDVPFCVGGYTLLSDINLTISVPFQVLSVFLPGSPQTPGKLQRCKPCKQAVSMEWRRKILARSSKKKRGQGAKEMGQLAWKRHITSCELGSHLHFA